MSIISNEHQNGSPFPEPPEQEPLPNSITYGDLRAKSVRCTTGGIFWKVVRLSDGRSFGTLGREVTRSDLRSILWMIDMAYNDGHRVAIGKIRDALGFK